MNRAPGLLVTVLIAAVVSVLTAGVTVYVTQHMMRGRVELTTPFQAVQLTNGAAYFCKIEGLGSAFPVLREIYFIQRNQNPDTKQVSNILLSRAKEWWQPDRMIVSASSILSVEPVNPTSRVAELIAEEKQKK